MVFLGSFHRLQIDSNSALGEATTNGGRLAMPTRNAGLIDTLWFYGGFMVVLWEFMGVYGSYLLVMTNIALENHHFQWENPLFQWSFSIAMLNYQRVVNVGQ